MKTGKTYTNGNISVSITVLVEPMDKNIVGIILSDYFADNIGLLLDDNPNGYDLASLQVNADGKLPLILIERKIYEMLQKDASEAEFIIFHELGHYFNSDHKGLPGDYQEKREASIKKGEVLPMELKADDFALGFLGKEKVIAGLEWLIKEEENKPETDEDVIAELRLRLKHQTERQ